MVSRVAKNPIFIPNGVELGVSNQVVSIKGPKGNVKYVVPREVSIEQAADKSLTFAPRNKRNFQHNALAGTTRALVHNNVIGVSVGFEKKLEIRGTGYRAKVQGSKLDLSLGFSHPVVYLVPDDIQIETPSQTEIVVRGIDKQRVGQVAAEIRAYRPPDSYKGKGVRYSGEVIVLKETKKNKGGNMGDKINKFTRKERRSKRIRKHIQEIQHRYAREGKRLLRLSVNKTARHISAQIFCYDWDKKTQSVVAAASTMQAAIKQQCGYTGNIEAAKIVGQVVAEKALALRSSYPDLPKVVFDRSGFKFHGRIKAFADSARAGGLDF